MENGNKKRNLIVIVLSVIIVLLVGVLVYLLFIKKDDKQGVIDNTPKDNVRENQQVDDKQGSSDNGTKENIEKDNNSQNASNKNIYKTADGKNVLDIRNIGKESGEIVYNGVKLDSYGYSYAPKTGKYVVYTADKKGVVSQCGSYSFVVNTENNSLVDFMYDLNKQYRIEIINNKYYFMEYNSCLTHQSGIYSENLKKLGEIYLGKESNNTFYVLAGGYVIKYDKDAKIVKKSEESYMSENILYGNPQATDTVFINNGNIYFLYLDDGYSPDNTSDDYLVVVDAMENKKYKVVNYHSYDTFDYNFEYNATNKYAKITLYQTKSCGDGCSETDRSKEFIYKFDLNSKKITKE